MENVHLLNSRTPATSASCVELKDILRECSTGKRILEVFPSDKAAASDTADNNTKLHLDKDALSHKILWLRALADLYESQLPLFSTGSGQSFGRLEGSKVALFVETTEQLCGEESRLTSYKEAIGLLTREQLSGKETVQLFRFGSLVEPCSLGCLAFPTDLESCFKFASEWIASLAPLGQDCNLLGALKVAAGLTTIDTACVVVATRPDQTADVVGDYMLSELTGRDSPKLHLVAFSDADSSTYAVLKAVAEAVGGSYHGSFVKENHQCGGHHYEVEDTEMMKLKGELQRVRSILRQLEDLQHGVLCDGVMASLRELSMEGPWNMDMMQDGAGPHSILCTSREWLAKHGLEAEKLSLYQVLGPNAYSQLEGHVQSLHKKVTSRVYNTSMPLFKWHDQTQKYLHVDVHVLEQYKRKLVKFRHDVERRLNWLRSGSRVPFGSLSEENVIIVLAGSPPSRHTFAHFLQLFFEEQLCTRHSFNLVRVGRWYDVWRKGLVEPSLANLQEAWRWATEDTGCHSNRGLLPSLRHIMEDWTVNEHNCGIYLLLFHPPTDAMDGVCSYLEQKVPGTAVGVSIIYYDVLKGRGGESAFPILRKLAGGGRGRLHHFMGTMIGGSDDIDDIIKELDRVKLFSETVDQILANYCHLCKPSLEQTVSCLPRSRPHSAVPHTASPHTLATERLVRSDPRASFPPSHKGRRSPWQEVFHLDRGLEKGIAVDFGDVTKHRHSSKQVPIPYSSKQVLIPYNEEPMTSKEWLARYGIEALGLSYEKLAVSAHNRLSAVYRHTSTQLAAVPHAQLAVVPQQLRSLCQKLQWTLQRYQKRLHWLHTGSNKVFGSVIERKVVLMLDISASMTSYFPTLKECVESLLRERPNQLKSFNIVAFATAATLWQNKCVPMSEESCTAAVKWVESLKSGGEACVLEALWVALDMKPRGIYLVSNGAMTSTNDFLLGQLSFLRERFGDSWRLNTVSFCCKEGCAHTFLKALAHSGNGRHHTWLPNEMQDDIQEWTKLRTTSHESDDVVLLVREMELARNQLRNVKALLSASSGHYCKPRAS